MAKARTAAPVLWDAERFTGKTFVLAGQFSRHDREHIEGLIEDDGGEVVAEVSETTSYVVVGKVAGKTTLAQKKAEKLNAGGQATIQVLSREEFFKLVTPSPELAEAILRAGAQGYERWKSLMWGHPTHVDLTGRDLRGLDLRKFWLYRTNLEGADLRESDLSEQWGLEVARTKLDGARLVKVGLNKASEARLRKAVLTEARFWEADLQRADFTGADLSKASGGKANAADAVFSRATLVGAELKEAKLTGADFSGADLSKADLRGADLSKAKLSKGVLRGADLSQAVLAGADLTKADLRDAILVGADLTGATLAGADFTGANVTGLKLDGVDTSKAKGLSAQAAPVTAGASLQELDRYAAQAGSVKLQASVRLPDGQLMPLVVTVSHQGQQATAKTPKAPWGGLKATSASAGLIQAAQPFLHGHLQLDTVKAQAAGGPYGGKKLQQLAVAAWCEAFGRAVPAGDDLAAQVEADRVEAQKGLEALLADLRSGPEGVKRWNDRTSGERQHAGPFRGVDLSGAVLEGINLESRDFREASFAGSSLAGANLWLTDFRKAKLAQANLSGAKARRVSFASADLAGADLRGADLRHARFRGALLSGADLRGADASEGIFTGADLTGAQLEGTKLAGAEFDDKTVWPAGFTPPLGMNWKGTGPDPRYPRPAATAGPAAPATPAAPAPTPTPAPAPAAPALSLTEFMDRLRGVVDTGRLANALQMLRAERFQLFTQVEEGKLVGVIRSQSSDERVYACKLCGDGSFSCGTQNLRVCGGLAGAICKHLLVLIVGLARSGQVDLEQTYQWVKASRSQRPAFDKDEAAAVFLRYKGAEAGEIDWRPTETVPEDYHVF